MNIYEMGVQVHIFSTKREVRQHCLHCFISPWDGLWSAASERHLLVDTFGACLNWWKCTGNNRVESPTHVIIPLLIAIKIICDYESRYTDRHPPAIKIICDYESRYTYRHPPAIKTICDSIYPESRYTDRSPPAIKDSRPKSD